MKKSNLLWMLLAVISVTSFLSMASCRHCDDSGECEDYNFGGSGDGGSTSNPSPTQNPQASVVLDQLVVNLCNVAVECGSELTVSGCRNRMNGPEGASTWGFFGLGMDNQLTTSQIKAALDAGEIRLDADSASGCLDEIEAMECNEAGKAVFQVDDEASDFPCTTILEEVVS